MVVCVGWVDRMGGGGGMWVRMGRAMEGSFVSVS